VPAWSPEIANELIRLAAAEGRALDQMQLQKLVYIAHGWCLAISGEPLTGDRPEAWDVGPMYRRLANALVDWGPRPITGLTEATRKTDCQSTAIWSELNQIERNVLTSVQLNYGHYSSSQLSALTRGEDGPWASVYRTGEGRFRDIPHAMIRDQFVRFAQQVRNDRDHD
jgi:uncharacterized phage-associated protein